MAIKYGISFPFGESLVGDYLSMTTTREEEIRSNLSHLILTRKGSRYFLPDFGTRLYDFIFDLNDSITHASIERDIRDSVRKYLPNLDINSIVVTSAESVNELGLPREEEGRTFNLTEDPTKPHTAKVRIDYTINNSVFATSDFIIINI